MPEDITEELAAEAKIDTEKLRHVIINILSNPNNWMVSDIKKGDNKTRIELKPL
ncbi:MAG: hypothetical protein WA364_13915 [Candidatus Nitrosopolaris sp.]